MARHLVDREDLAVVTNALDIATELATAAGVTVVVTGGMMRASELSLVGHIAGQALREVQDAGTPAELETRKLDASSKSFLLALLRGNGGSAS